MTFPDCQVIRGNQVSLRVLGAINKKCKEKLKQKCEEDFINTYYSRQAVCQRRMEEWKNKAGTWVQLAWRSAIWWGGSFREQVRKPPKLTNKEGTWGLANIWGLKRQEKRSRNSYIISGLRGERSNKPHHRLTWRDCAEGRNSGREKCYNISLKELCLALQHGLRWACLPGGRASFLGVDCPSWE